MPTDRAQDTEAIRAALHHARKQSTDQLRYADAVVALDRLVARLEAAERALLAAQAGYDAFYTLKGAESWHALLNAERLVRAALAASAPGETTPTCICPRFRDLAAGTIIADLTCPVHGVNGTEPGDVLPDEYAAPGETEQTP